MKSCTYTANDGCEVKFVVIKDYSDIIKLVKLWRVLFVILICGLFSQLSLFTTQYQYDENLTWGESDPRDNPQGAYIYYDCITMAGTYVPDQTNITRVVR